MHASQPENTPPPSHDSHSGARSGNPDDCVTPRGNRSGSDANATHSSSGTARFGDSGDNTANRSCANTCGNEASATDSIQNTPGEFPAVRAEREQEPREPLPCPFGKLYPSQLKRDDVFYMSLAYNQAIEAWKADETPIGAIIERNGEIIAAAHNSVDRSADPTAHAEMLAITQAANAIGDWRLNECRLYVTKEPCPMCAGASIMARLKEVVFAVGDPKMGYLGGAVCAHTAAPGLNHHLNVRSGVLEAECLELLQGYFRLKRQMSLEKKV